MPSNDINKVSTQSVLNHILKLFPLNHEIPYEDLEFIQDSLQRYKKQNVFSEYRSQKTELESTYQQIAQDINLEFEGITEGDFDGFKLSISAETLRRFAKNVAYSHNSGKSNKINSRNSSIRLIAAFLTLPSINIIQINEFSRELKKIDDGVSRLKDILKSIKAITPKKEQHDFAGVYGFKRKTFNESVNYIRLKFGQRLSDGYYLIDEYEETIPNNKFRQPYYKNSNGFGFLASNGVLSIYLVCEDEHMHSYQCLYLSEKNHTPFRIYLLKLADTIECDENDDIMDNILDCIEPRILAFEKETQSLTFSLERTANNINNDRGSKNPFFGQIRKSNQAGKGLYGMTPEQQNKLNKELESAIIDCNPYLAIEKLRQGASINAVITPRGGTIIHVFAGNASLPLIKDALEAAQDEWDPLKRDRTGYLPSFHANRNKLQEFPPITDERGKSLIDEFENGREFESYQQYYKYNEATEGDIKTFLRHEETKAAAKKGYDPGIKASSDRPLSDEEAAYKLELLDI